MTSSSSFLFLHDESEIFNGKCSDKVVKNYNLNPSMTLAKEQQILVVACSVKILKKKTNL